MSRKVKMSSAGFPTDAAGRTNSEGANTRSNSSFQAITAPVRPVIVRNSASTRPV